VDLTDYEGYNRTAENITAGIGHTSRNASFSLTYQRGFTSAIGISELLYSDIFSAVYGHRINRWMNARLESYYYRSSEQNTGGLLETFSGGGGLEFALRRDLFLGVNAYYQNQHEEQFSVGSLGLNRLTAYAGIQYVWPAKRRSGY
jgi:hypothetical protein